MRANDVVGLAEQSGDPLTVRDVRANDLSAVHALLAIADAALAAKEEPEAAGAISSNPSPGPQRLMALGQRCGLAEKALTAVILLGADRE